MKFEIWQMPLNNPNKFMWYGSLKKPVDIKDYVHVYTGKTGAKMGNRRILEMLFQEFNVNHPNDYHSSSMSVSDIICTINEETNERTWWYVDGIGFVKIKI